MINIGNDWDNLLADQFSSEYYQNLREFLINEYKTKTIYPSKYDIFNALKETAYQDVKVVILGQDPYHGEGQAHGMCFSVKEDMPPPPSLVNIFKELKSDIGCEIPKNGYLLPWAKQGVLLLNTVLTVRASQANSHKGMGWEILTDRIISLLNERQTPMVFVLWGSPARKKKTLITNNKHLILETVHPSPLSAYNGFFGCQHFSKANEFLKDNGLSSINWEL